MPTVQPQDDLDRIFDHRATRIMSGILGIARAAATGESVIQARARLGKIIDNTRGLTNIIGRRRTWLAHEDLKAHAFAQATRMVQTDVLPDVTFEEAVDAITTRTPEVLPEALQNAPSGVKADYVGQLYNDGGFAISGTTSDETVKRVQKIIADALATGQETPDAVDIIDELLPFARSRSETIFRNNVTGAYADGIYTMMDDPAVSAVIAALRFDSAGDTDVTAICKAFEGTVAPHKHVIWNKRTMPCHHG